MSWNLRIQGKNANGDTLQLGSALGAFADVRLTLESYFPTIDWRSFGRGEFQTEDVLIEMDIHGDPVEHVLFRIRRGDPSQAVIALAHDRGWDVINEESGNRLEEDVEVDFDLISQIQTSAATHVETRARSGKTPEIQLPSIKKKRSLGDYQPEWKLERLFLISLNEAEVTQDFVEAYVQRFEDVPKPPDATSFTFGTTEIHLPDGRRLAVLSFISPNHAGTQRHLMEYSQERSSFTAVVQDRKVRVSDASEFEVADCVLVERNSGRGRRISR